MSYGNAYVGGVAGGAAGAAAGMPFGPVGMGVGGTFGSLYGTYQGYQSGKEGKGGMSKFGAKRSKKAMQAAARQELRTMRRQAEFGLKHNPKLAKQQMKMNEEWINRQRPLIEKGRKSDIKAERAYQKKYGRKDQRAQEKYQERFRKTESKAQNKFRDQEIKRQNRYREEQIPINAKINKAEQKQNIRNFREMQPEVTKAQMRHMESMMPLQEKAMKNQLNLTRKYGMPERIEKEKFYKKSLLTPQQQKTHDYLNKQGRNQKSSLDIRQNPLYKQATGVLGNYLSNDPEARQQRLAPHLKEFQEDILPGIISQTGIGGQRTGAKNRAMAQATSRFGTQMGKMDEVLRQSALDKALAYAQAPTQGRQQEIQNAQQNAQMGMGTKGFERMYKPSMYANVTGMGMQSNGGQFNQAAMAQGGGPSFPSNQMPGYQQRPQSQMPAAQQMPGLNMPNINMSGGGGGYAQFFNQQQPSGASNGFNNMMSGFGQGAGQAGANYVSNNAGDWLKNAFNQPQVGNVSQGANPMYGQGGFTGGGWKGMS